MALQFVTKNSLARVDEATSPQNQVSVDGTKTAYLDLPYDIGFIAGYDKNYTAEEVAVRTYGQTVMGRKGNFVGTVGYLDSSPNGNTIIDIEKNGTSIFSTKPQFTQTNALTGGILSTTTFNTRDRITFKVTAIGLVAQPGTGMRVILKCKV
jgi:hypothetical protein